jgi:hypothetical protein
MFKYHFPWMKHTVFKRFKDFTTVTVKGIKYKSYVKKSGNKIKIKITLKLIVKVSISLIVTAVLSGVETVHHIPAESKISSW